MGQERKTQSRQGVQRVELELQRTGKGMENVMFNQ